MNKVVLIGRLTKDVELRYTENNMSVAKFTLAVKKSFKNVDGEYESDFFNIVVWNMSAENCSKYLHKGSKVAVDGRIQTRSYEKDGQKRYVTEIVANKVEFLDSKKQNTNETQKEEIEEKDPFEEFGEIVTADNEDLPF